MCIRDRLCTLNDKFLKFTKLFYYWKNPLLLFRIYYLSVKFINLSLPFVVLKSLNSNEHNNGANKPVIKTWAHIVLILGKYKKIVWSDQYLIKIWKIYSEPQKKLAIEQIKPNLKCPIKLLFEIPNFPNHIPHKSNPGICVKLLSRLNESKMSPKNKPIIKPSNDP